MPIWKESCPCGNALFCWFLGLPERSDRFSDILMSNIVTAMREP